MESRDIGSPLFEYTNFLERKSPPPLIVDPPSPVNLNLPNFGAAWIATILKTRVIDLHALPLPQHRLFRAAPAQLAISVRSFNRSSAEEIAKEFSRRYPESRVTSLTGIVDVQCCYGFESFPDNVHIEHPFNDSLPFPEYERFDSFRYLHANWKSGFWAYPIMTARGCPFPCAYCAARRRPWHPRSAEHAVEELSRAKHAYDIQAFEIIDDVFNLDEARSIRFCELVQPLGLSWSCANGIRADRFSERQARAMAASGCRQVGFGIESTSEEVLQAVSKGESFARMEQAIRIAQDHFSTVSGFFILGLPGSTYERDHESILWARDMHLKAYFSYFVPPGSNDGVYFGTLAQPRSPAYPIEQQRELYALARGLNRDRYLAEGLPGKVLRTTCASLQTFDFRSGLNHAAHLLKRGWSALTRGEIQ